MFSMFSFIVSMFRLKLWESFWDKAFNKTIKFLKFNHFQLFKVFFVSKFQKSPIKIQWNSHLSVWAVFDSLFSDDIRMGIFFVFPDALSDEEKWLNCTEFIDLRVNPALLLWWAAFPWRLFLKILLDFAYSSSS